MTWKGISIAQASEIMFCEEAFKICLEDILSRQLIQLRDRPSYTDQSPHEEASGQTQDARSVKHLLVSIDELIDAMCQKGEQEGRQFTLFNYESNPVDVLRSFISTHDCFANPMTGGLCSEGSVEGLTCRGRDSIVTVRLPFNFQASNGSLSYGETVEIVWRPYHIIFDNLDVCPYEGSRFFICPQLLPSFSDLNGASESRNIIFSLESSLDWLEWDEIGQGFAGTIPFYSMQRDAFLDSTTVIDESRLSRPDTNRHVLRIEVKATITEWCDGNVRYERVIRTRITVKVVSRNAYRSSRVLASIPETSYNSLEHESENSDRTVAQLREISFSRASTQGDSESSINPLKRFTSLREYVDPPNVHIQQAGDGRTSFHPTNTPILNDYQFMSIMKEYKPPEKKPGTSPRMQVEEFFTHLNDRATRALSKSQLPSKEHEEIAAENFSEVRVLFQRADISVEKDEERNEILIDFHELPHQAEVGLNVFDQLSILDAGTPLHGLNDVDQIFNLNTPTPTLPPGLYMHNGMIVLNLGGDSDLIPLYRRRRLVRSNHMSGEAGVIDHERPQSPSQSSEAGRSYNVSFQSSGVGPNPRLRYSPERQSSIIHNDSRAQVSPQSALIDQIPDVGPSRHAIIDRIHDVRSSALDEEAVELESSHSPTRKNDPARWLDSAANIGLGTNRRPSTIDSATEADEDYATHLQEEEYGKDEDVETQVMADDHSGTETRDDDEPELSVRDGKRPTRDDEYGEIRR
ncbi:MAG: hypothetical protein M1827_000196 [Pycnora praestabilis]|nr:MAG: hypothetical protein M1827_000196 [Pycnora praestabilis]